jgi:parvulin-like peptidyl-prolyl isomerase
MSDAPFPAPVAAALNQLTVPSLPNGFAERLLQRLEAGDLPIEAVGELPTLRRTAAMRKWRRSGIVAIGLVAMGVTSATAAASGFFGKPVYVPVVSEVLAKADIVKLPAKSVMAPKPKTVSKPAPDNAELKSEVTGVEAVRQMYQRLRADKEFRALPQRERAEIAREELAALLRAGTIKPEDIGTAMRAMRQDQLAKQVEKTSNGEQQQHRKRQVPPEVVAKRRAAIATLPVEDKLRLLELRRQLRDAPPAERPAIRREIREILQRAVEKGLPAEGNPEPAR